MNATLRDRLILVEQLFLIAIVAQDEKALGEISLELSWLVHHFKAVEASGNLDDNTALLLSRVSRVIRATTQCMLECEDALKDAQTALISCSNLPLPSDDLLVSTSPPTFPPFLLFSHVSPSGTFCVLGHNKLLDACAYRWLMQNMHNPYPTSTQLQIIGDESMTSVAQAELWFQEARDSVGWTKLSDEFFASSLNATITAAKRVYLEHDDAMPFCIALAFSKVKAYMETLFAEHPTLPPLTSHVGYSAQAVPLGLNGHLDNMEIEDTTPPPSVAGCKRKFPEHSVAALASDLNRPLKRLRYVHFKLDSRSYTTENIVRDSAHSPRQVHLHSEGMPPLSVTGSSSKKSATEALAHTSAIPVTFIEPSDPLLQVSLRPSPETLAFNFTGQRYTDIYDSPSEMVVVSSGPPAPQGEMRTQLISESSTLVPSEREISLSANHTRDPSPGSVPSFAWSVPPSLDHHPTDSSGVPQITVSPCIPVDLSVFNWNSIPNPLVETAVSTSTCRLPSLMHNGSSFESNRSTRVTLCPKLRPRSVELRASRSNISGTIRRTWIQPSLSIRRSRIIRRLQLATVSDTNNFPS